MQVFTYICAILFLHLSNQEGFSVPSIDGWHFFANRLFCVKPSLLFAWFLNV